MEAPSKSQRRDRHNTNGLLMQAGEVPSQCGGDQESNTFGGIGIQSKGNFTVTGDFHMVVNGLTEEQLLKATERNKQEREELEERIQRENEEARQQKMESLHFPQMDTRQVGIKKAYASTCQWILTNHQYERWARSRQGLGSDRFIWLKGKPGTGKSTMMKFLLGHIRRQLIVFDGNEVLISFFFNARGTDLEQTTVGLYRSLLLQLLQNRREVRPVLDDISSTHEWTVHSLIFIFEQAVLDLEGISLICLIDALDECGVSEARDIVRFFNQLTQTHDHVHVCFASRHYPHISMTTALEIVLEHQHEHHEDIRRYLNSTLQIGCGQIADQICSDVLTRSSGVFMWVVLVVDILNREFDAGRKHTLRKRLKEIPQDLHRLFRDILTRDTDNVEGLLLCIQWILFARRPLAPKELYFAIISGLEPEYLQTCHTEDILEDDIKKYILGNSKGLAEPIGYPEATVQFIHESVVDFLIKDHGLATIFADLGGKIRGRSHDTLKSCCLRYIEFVEFSWPGKDDGGFEFASYAQKEFIYHADQAEAEGIDQTDFMAYFCLGTWIWPLEGDFHPPTPLYFLASKGAATLIRVHSVGQCGFMIEEASYAMPIMAAAAAGMSEAALALLEIELHGVPVLSFQNLRGPALQLSHNDVDKARMSSHRFMRDMDTFVQLAKFAPELVIIAFLRTVEINANVTDCNGRTPLFHAISRDHYVLMGYLIELGADLSLRDREGGLPTHWAVRHGSTKAFSILHRNGCTIDAQDDEGWTPMHYAVHQDLGMINFLMECGLDINSSDKIGQTPLHHAIRYKFFETVRFLVENKADIEARDEEGRTSLHCAIQHKSYDSLEILLQNKADIEARDEEGRTPLHCAIRHGSSCGLHILVQYGAHIDARDKQRRTPLHYAMMACNVDLTESLLSNKADFSAVDIMGKAPTAYALWHNGSLLHPPPS